VITVSPRRPPFNSLEVSVEWLGTVAVVLVPLLTSSFITWDWVTSSPSGSGGVLGVTCWLITSSKSPRSLYLKLFISGPWSVSNTRTTFMYLESSSPSFRWTSYSTSNAVGYTSSGVKSGTGT
jgi:hypothetical protein